jgi:hypothetical protein
LDGSGETLFVIVSIVRVTLSVVLFLVMLDARLFRLQCIIYSVYSARYDINISLSDERYLYCISVDTLSVVVLLII